MPWLTILAKYWKPLAIVAVSVLAFVYVRHLGVTATEAKYKPLVAAANLARDQAIADEKAVTENFQKAQQASKGYQDELAKLHAAASAAPARSVRLCSGAPAIVPEADPAGGHNGAAPGTGTLPQEPGPDVGSRFYADADEADRVLAQARACQAYADSLRQ